MSADQVEIQTLRTTEDFDACVAVQIAVWGYADGDVIPRRMFIVASHVGGQVFGARLQDNLIGFALALPGVRHGAPYLHSHMLAILPEYRNLGLGRKLKLKQREDALGRGITLMEWTFDPMQTKNAYFNLQRLGATSSQYLENFYGRSSSPLQGGLPTDRLVAQWWLNSERVLRAMQGEHEQPRIVDKVAAADVHTQDREANLLRLRAELQAAFARSLQVVGFERAEGEVDAYLIGPKDEADTPLGEAI